MDLADNWKWSDQYVKYCIIIESWAKIKKLYEQYGGTMGQFLENTGTENASAELNLKSKLKKITQGHFE